MAYKWTCPYCGRSEYSASAFRDKKRIRCVYCSKEYRNPYYEGKEGRHNGKEKRTR